MEVKYLVRNNEELEFLTKAYNKLTKYYNIESANGLKIEPTFSSVKILPQGIDSEISKIERNNLKIVVEENEDFCERCGPIFHEEKTEFGYHIDIKGTNYNIKLKNKSNQEKEVII